MFVLGIDGLVLYMVDDQEDVIDKGVSNNREYSCVSIDRGVLILILG